MVTTMRQYEQSHPWLNFRLDLSRFPYTLWLALGEAQSKCEHIAGVPLAPEVAKRLHNIYLAKGTLATAAIEGNTLSEEEALKRIEGKKELPPSKEYLGQELDNIIEACNLIDHYNQTRTEYYRQLDLISKKKGDVVEFFEYAIQGYVDGLKDQLKIIKGHQFDVAWINYVHTLFKDKDTATHVRKRNLVLDLPKDIATPIHKVKEVSPRIAEAYAGKDFRTIARDAQVLINMGLITRTREGIRPTTEIINAFLPMRWQDR